MRYVIELYSVLRVRNCGWLALESRLGQLRNWLRAAGEEKIFARARSACAQTQTLDTNKIRFTTYKCHTVVGSSARARLVVFEHEWNVRKAEGTRTRAVPHGGEEEPLEPNHLPGVDA